MLVQAIRQSVQEFGAVGFSAAQFADGFVIIAQVDLHCGFRSAHDFRQIGMPAVKAAGVMKGCQEFN